ncbi:uncharacterized protein LACBIDRAFT_314361 [Laccaria bicolor S238N-H82]|uniref:Predicted protein n=1 Tax=Laccaria bicolor (strain S238N-H82 / ATCC MYA-4686) TaxID=486041 RepID=B0DYD6_LACBS|nr:uncharacterized protein LACBIDRAFT_314361 [Laccaria bicolor S238N-H82]EDR00370.1 predicted protein [Laccaria bicolor S238N-H82]|eukprot:XP_001888929.1 predicted protein [Laccaria bicolor S238N-H82]
MAQVELPNQDTLDISHIAGNASPEIKRFLGYPSLFFGSHMSANVDSPIFGEEIQKRIKVTELSVDEKREEASRLEGRVVAEIVVAEDMLNGNGTLHGGCIAWLIDMCSSLALTALRMTTSGKFQMSVTQSLNVVYHSPASLGDKIRLVNTTLTLGARAHSVRTEIWNDTHRRLVASGVHIKMLPSAPKASL